MLLKNQSVRLAFCGMLTALAVAVMLCTYLIPAATYALPATAGVILIAAVIEIGASWAWPVYVASSVLSFLLAADKEAAVIYVLFFGYYPIVKALIERRKLKRGVTVLLKALVFNAAMVLYFFAALYILAIPRESFYFFGVYMPYAFLIFGNILFFLYDYTVSGMVMLYFQRIHPLFARWFKK